MRIREDYVNSTRFSSMINDKIFIHIPITRSYRARCRDVTSSHEIFDLVYELATIE